VLRSALESEWPSRLAEARLSAQARPSWSASLAVAGWVVPTAQITSAMAPRSSIRLGSADRPSTREPGPAAGRSELALLWLSLANYRGVMSFETFLAMDCDNTEPVVGEQMTAVDNIAAQQDTTVVANGVDLRCRATTRTLTMHRALPSRVSSGPVGPCPAVTT
jgi:hypothetical protein